MKKILLATSALAATAGIASAQAGGGGLTVSGTASIGILGGEWLVPAIVNGRTNIVETDEYELHTDIDVTFTMSGQTDTGLTFGASIDLDESDGVADVDPSTEGDQPRGNSLAFDGRTQGGEEIFISGGFGTLTMGDTDGALDWALKDIGLGSSLGDAHTAHLGYIGNDFVDDGNRYASETTDTDDGDGQIIRYDRSFGDFAVAFSADIAEADGKDILSAGAKYSVSLPAMRLGVGVGWQQRAPHQLAEGDEKDASGVSLDAEFDNGFQIVLNWADLGDSDEGFGRIDNTVTEEFKGIGLAYATGDWTFAANWGQITEGEPLYTGQEGYGIAVNYDLGGGAEVQMGFSESKCEPIMVDENGRYVSGGAVFEVSDDRCFERGDDDSTFSLGVAMNF